MVELKNGWNGRAVVGSTGAGLEVVGRGRDGDLESEHRPGKLEEQEVPEGQAEQATPGGEWGSPWHSKVILILQSAPRHHGTHSASA